MQEVVVTATKRAENVQNLPFSVSVVTEQVLRSQNLADTSDLKRLVPGLNFTSASTVANSIFILRGVGTVASGAGLEQSVGVTFDGMPLARSPGSISDLLDIQRVEVPKGPQGKLFGKNASAGLINIVSQSAKVGTTEVSGRVSYGTLNYQQYTGTVDAPLGDIAAIRLSEWRFEHEGFVHEANTCQDGVDRDAAGV